MLHICPDIIKLLHIRPGLLIGRIGFPFLLQKSGIFPTQRLDRRQLCDPQPVKVFLRRLVQKDLRFMRCPEFFAVPGFPVFHIDRPRLGIIYDLFLQLPIGGHLRFQFLNLYRQRIETGGSGI